MQRLTIRLLPLLAVLALLAAACGQDPAVEDEVADTPEETDEAADDETADDEAAEDATVQVSDSEFGEILTDAEGMTLYLFQPDEGGGESTCYDECAEAWPALTVDGEPTASEELDEGMLSTTERDDGETQVVYNGHPLYHFAQDEEAGDTNGQSLNDVWWVVSPEGEAIEEAPADGS